MLKHILIFTVVALLLLFLVACEGGGTVDPIKVVPQNSNLLIWMDLSGIADDEDISELYEVMPEDEEMKETLDDAMELISGLKEGILFMDLSATSETDVYAGILIKGTFVENDLVADIEEMADKELEIAGYKEYQIYTDQLEEVGLAFISSDVFGFGSIETIKDVIDVKEGSGSAVNGDISDLYDSLGDGKVKLAATIPEGLLDNESLDSEGEMGISTEGAEALADIETIGMVFDSDEENVSVKAKLCFSNSESAAETMDFLQGIIAIVEWFSPEEGSQGIVDLIDKLDMYVEDFCIIIDFQATVEEIEEASQDILNGIDLKDLGDGGIGGFDFGEDYEFDEDFFKNFEFEWEFDEDLLNELGEAVES